MVKPVVLLPSVAKKYCLTINGKLTLGFGHQNWLSNLM